LVSPVMPSAAAEMAQQLGIADSFGVEGGWETETKFGVLKPGTRTGEATPLFPRIDTKKLAAAAPKEEKPKQEKAAKVKPMSETKTEMPGAAEAASVADPYITIDDFAKVQLKVADIVSVTKVPNADKLLHLKINVGEGEDRDLLSAIAEFYQPEELVGKKIVVIANLAPRKMRGVISQGMLLAVDGPDGRPILLTPESEVPAGSTVR